RRAPGDLRRRAGLHRRSTAPRPLPGAHHRPGGLDRPRRRSPRGGFRPCSAVGAGNGEAPPRRTGAAALGEAELPRCETAVPELDPRWFSFNTAQGRCEVCEGTGLLEVESTESGEAQGEPCPACDGSRLQPIPRGVRLFGRRYAEVVQQPVTRALAEVQGWRLRGDEERIGGAARGGPRGRAAFPARGGRRSPPPGPRPP